MAALTLTLCYSYVMILVSVQSRIHVVATCEHDQIRSEMEIEHITPFRDWKKAPQLLPLFWECRLKLF